MPESEYKLDMVSVRLVPDAPILSDHKIITKEDAVAVMKEFLSEMDRELLCIINLRSDGTPINGHIVSMGAINQTIVNPRELFKAAILSNAAGMIMLHSHPSGDASPSKQDVIVTDKMIHACDLMGIPLLDHIIVGGNTKEQFSFRENSMLHPAELDLKSECRELEFGRRGLRLRKR